MNIKKIDYIIVGQGLAGSCLALQLIQRGKKIVVYDQPGDNHSTAVAAGLFNPITGKMLAKTWSAELLFPYFQSFYTNAEILLQSKFFYPMPIYRPFISVEEQNEWMGRSTNASMAGYIERINLTSEFGNDVNDAFGGVLLRQGGYLDSQRFVEATRKLLETSGSYKLEKFVESSLDDEGDYAVYADLSASKVIYCRGVEELVSGCFSWLPIVPLKGETLSVTLPRLSRIYNRGVYIVPGTTTDSYTVGSTYDFDNAPGVTEKGRAALEDKLAELIRHPYTIVGGNWGIRPTTPDRRPLLGSHPKHGKRVIFNGLGTKGVVLAPYFSGHLVDWLEGEAEITPGVNIKRFKSLYSRFEA